MLLIQALRKAKTAKRSYWLSKECHTLAIFYNNSGYYTLTREIKDTWEDVVIERKIQQWNFRYLTNLFAFAKQEGFFEEIAPNADDWTDQVLAPTGSIFGSTSLPACCYAVTIPFLSEEEEELEREIEQEKIEEYAWASEHPGEAYPTDSLEDPLYPTWESFPNFIGYSDNYGRRYSTPGNDIDI